MKFVGLLPLMLPSRNKLGIISILFPKFPKEKLSTEGSENVNSNINSSAVIS